LGKWGIWQSRIAEKGFPKPIKVVEIPIRIR